MGTALLEDGAAPFVFLAAINPLFGRFQCNTTLNITGLGRSHGHSHGHGYGHGHVHSHGHYHGHGHCHDCGVDMC